MRYIFLTSVAVASLALLTACNSNKSRSNSGLESSLSPGAGAELNGTWLPTDAAAKGVYEAEFKNGVFISRSPSTDKPLAKGNYKIVSNKEIALEFVGAATNKVVRAKCDRQSTDTLYCVPTVGSPFNLKRT
jgi:hypothetical protein